MRIPMAVVYRYGEDGHALVARFIARAYAERYARELQAKDPSAKYDVEDE